MPHHQGAPLLRDRSAHGYGAPRVTECSTQGCWSRPAPHHAGHDPRPRHAGPCTSGLGGARAHALLQPCAGTAGSEKGAMAVLDDAEATTYRMLQQVLQNHYTAHTLCLPYTLVACGALVALVCAQADAPPGALESLVAHMLADLKRLTRARRATPRAVPCGVPSSRDPGTPRPERGGLPGACPVPP